MTEQELQQKVREKVEYIEENQTVGVYDSEEELNREVGWNEGYVSGYEDGYIAGVKENGVIWHDLRKNPDDLPKKVGNYIVCYLDSMLERHTFELSYVDYLVKEHWIDEYNHNIETYDEGVIAWCEIPKFEEGE